MPTTGANTQTHLLEGAKAEAEATRAARTRICFIIVQNEIESGDVLVVQVHG
jgi:hypothetical protein